MANAHEQHGTNYEMVNEANNNNADVQMMDVDVEKIVEEILLEVGKKREKILKKLKKRGLPTEAISQKWKDVMLIIVVEIMKEPTKKRKRAEIEEAKDGNASENEEDKVSDDNSADVKFLDQLISSIRDNQDNQQHYVALFAKTEANAILLPHSGEYTTIQSTIDNILYLEGINQVWGVAQLHTNYRIGESYDQLHTKFKQRIEVIANKVNRDERTIRRYRSFYNICKDYPGLLWSGSTMTEIIRKKKFIEKADDKYKIVLKKELRH